MCLTSVISDNSCKSNGQLRMSLYAAQGATLQKASFGVEDVQSLFQTSNLCGAFGRTLRICLCFGNAHLVELFEVVQNRVKLSLLAFTISLGRSNVSRKSANFLFLVLSILLFRGACHLVLLGHLFILGLSGVLCCGSLGECLGEITLDNFQKAKNTVDSTFVVTAR